MVVKLWITSWEAGFLRNHTNAITTLVLLYKNSKPCAERTLILWYFRKQDSVCKAAIPSRCGVVRRATSVPKHRSHDLQSPNLFHLQNKCHCHTSNPMHSLQYILFPRRAGSPYWKTVPEVLASTQDKGWWITFQSISTTKRDVGEKHDQFRTMITARLSIHWSISGKWIVKKTELIQVNVNTFIQQ